MTWCQCAKSTTVKLLCNLCWFNLSWNVELCVVCTVNMIDTYLQHIPTLNPSSIAAGCCCKSATPITTSVVTSVWGTIVPGHGYTGYPVNTRTHAGPRPPPPLRTWDRYWQTPNTNVNIQIHNTHNKTRVHNILQGCQQLLMYSRPLWEPLKGAKSWF